MNKRSKLLALVTALSIPVAQGLTAAPDGLRTVRGWLVRERGGPRWYLVLRPGTNSQVRLELSHLSATGRRVPAGRFVEIPLIVATGSRATYARARAAGEPREINPFRNFE